MSKNKRKSSKPFGKGKAGRVIREARLNAFFENLTLDLLTSGSDDECRDAPSRLRMRMRKKAEYLNPAHKVEALNGFARTNECLSKVILNLEDERYDYAADFIYRTLNRYARRLDPENVQECFSLGFILMNWRFGPGTSNGTEGSGTVVKMDQDMSCTDLSEPFVTLLRRQHSAFRGIDIAKGSAGIVRVQGSRLTTVLKNEKGVRVIAIEPSGNMAIQLAGGRFIEDALRLIGLDIRTQQDLNRLLARLGSLYGELCTIDLSKASDMFLIELIKRVWPSEWFNFFMKNRSPVTDLPDGRRLELNMISTMGNGFTFPMMTMTLLALVVANRFKLTGEDYRYIDWSKTGIFGDDIIVPSHEYESLCSLLHLSGLLVNTEKSYQDGPFRESCGGDYLNGKDITPFYVKSLARPQNVYVAINQVLRWSAVHEVHLHRSLSYLFKLLDGKVFLVPEWCDDSSGVRTAQCPMKYKLLKPVPYCISYNGDYAMSLVCGGYLLQKGNGDFYHVSRRESTRYQVGHARLPESYLDGWDPRYGSHRESVVRSLLVSIHS